MTLKMTNNLPRPFIVIPMNKPNNKEILSNFKY